MRAAALSVGIGVHLGVVLGRVRKRVHAIGCQKLSRLDHVLRWEEVLLIGRGAVPTENAAVPGEPSRTEIESRAVPRSGSRRRAYTEGGWTSIATDELSRSRCSFGGGSLNMDGFGGMSLATPSSTSRDRTNVQRRGCAVRSLIGILNSSV